MKCRVCGLEHTDEWPPDWKPSDGIPNLQHCYPPVRLPAASNVDRREAFLATWMPRPFGRQHKARQTRAAKRMVAKWRAERRKAMEAAA